MTEGEEALTELFKRNPSGVYFLIQT